MGYTHGQRGTERVIHGLWKGEERFFMCCTRGQIDWKAHSPRMAELRAEQTLSRRLGHSCQPRGLAHGFEYANKLNASCDGGGKLKLENNFDFSFSPLVSLAYLQHLLVFLVRSLVLLEPLAHLEEVAAKLEHPLHARLAAHLVLQSLQALNQAAAAVPVATRQAVAIAS